MKIMYGCKVETKHTFKKSEKFLKADSNLVDYTRFGKDGKNADFVCILQIELKIVVP